MATVASPELISADHSDSFPLETGYYWCSRFGCVNAPQVMFVNCDDMDAGGRYALLVGSIERIAEDDKRFDLSVWSGPLKTPLPF